MLFVLLDILLWSLGLSGLFSAIRRTQLDDLLAEALHIIRHQQNINARLISRAQKQDAILQGYIALNRGQAIRLQALITKRDKKGRLT